MKICLCTNSSVCQFWNEHLSCSKGQDVIIFSFSGLGLVSYQDELSGQSESLSDIANLSKLCKCVVISGLDTDNYGVFKRSVVVADCGRILGINDKTHTFDESEFSSGYGVKTFETSKGRIGVIVDEDLYIPTYFSMFSQQECDFVVNIFKRIDNFMPQTTLRTLSFINGTAGILCSENHAIISNTCGEIDFSSTKNICHFNLDVENDFHNVTFRIKGRKKISI